MRYTIITRYHNDDFPNIPPVVVERYREDFALLALERAVWDAAKAESMLDRPIAHEAIRRARCWTKRHPLVEPIRIINHVVSIVTERN